MRLFRLSLKEKQFCYLEYFGTKFDESDNKVNEVVMELTSSLLAINKTNLRLVAALCIVQSILRRTKDRK